jgi:hypothetical protein
MYNPASVNPAIHKDGREELLKKMYQHRRQKMQKY